MTERPNSTVSDASLALATSTPLPFNDQDSLREPHPPFLESRTPSSLANSQSPSAIADSTTGFVLPVKNEAYAEEGISVIDTSPKEGKRRGFLFSLAVLIALGIIFVAVIVPVYFTVIKPKQRNTSSSSSHSGGSTTTATGHTATPTKSASPSSSTSGGDGSTIKAEDGSTFTYSNKFGGFWVSDPDNPTNNNAQPNSWTPPLNQSWDYGKNRIYGVNIGGLFVLEPFISPALFQKYPGATDEWDLSIAMAADTASGGLNQLEQHYDTFITEKDIADIAGAGLNWVRLPVPFWAIEKWPGEPFLEKTSWKYILRLLGWCRKYGIRVNLDLHTIPGSQNAYNHSGKGGQINFLHGVMGWANAQRALYYIRVLTEFISQPEWKDVVPMFSIMNEPLITTIGTDQLRAFYVEVHDMMRQITGFGDGNGPYMVIHDSFAGLTTFAGFMTGADRLALDSHPYFAFTGATTAAPIDSGTGAGAGGTWPAAACDRYGTSMNDSRVAFGVTVAGEFSNAFLDCGLFLKGVGGSPSYAGDCSVWQDSSTWTAGVKAGLMQFASAQMDSLGDYFFWTWKVGQSQRGIVESPLWSYQLGLEQGWMPIDPRSALGTCQSLGVAGSPFDGNYLPWQTGGIGAGAPTDSAQYPWPPASIVDGGPLAALPFYTPTGVISTLPPPTFTDSKGKTISIGNGWFDAQDTALAPTPIAGCTYPDPWNAENAAIPPLCGGGNTVVPPTAATAAATTTATTTTTTTPTTTTTTAPTTTITNPPLARL